MHGGANYADAVTYTWFLLTKPADSSAVLSDTTIAEPSFVPDKTGTYNFSLEVTQNGATSESDMVSVFASTRRYADIPVNIVAAEYDTSHDRMVIASTAPNKITFLNPSSGATAATSLGIEPLCLALSPDNTKAAIGHAGFVSIVGLNGATPSLVNTFTLSTHNYNNKEVQSIAINNEGHVFCFESDDQWIDLRRLSPSTGADTFYYISLSEDAFVRLHPSNNSLYYIQRALSSQDINWINISNPTSTAYTYTDSKYHGAYPTGQGMIFTETGDRALMYRGSVFSINESGDNTTDRMYVNTFASALPDGTARHLDHSSEAGLILAIPANGYLTTDNNQIIKYINASNYTQLRSVELPLFVQERVPSRAHGYYSFWNSTRTETYVLIKSDSAVDAPDWDLIVY